MILKLNEKMFFCVFGVKRTGLSVKYFPRFALLAKSRLFFKNVFVVVIGVLINPDRVTRVWVALASFFHVLQDALVSE